MWKLQSDWSTVDKAWLSYTMSNSSAALHGNVFLKDGRALSVDVEELELRNATAAGFEIHSKTSGDAGVFKKPMSTFEVATTNLCSIDVNADASLCAVGDEQGTIVIFDTRSGKEKQVTLSAHLLDVNRVLFFPSGRVLLSASSDMLVKVFDVATGVCAATLKNKVPVLGIAIIERGRNVLSCARDGSLSLWEIASQQCIQSFELDDKSLNDCVSDNAATSGFGDATATSPAQQHFQSGQVCLAASESGALHLVDLRAPRLSSSATCRGSSRVAFNSCALHVGTHRAYGALANGVLCVFDLRQFSNEMCARQVAAGATTLRTCGGDVIHASSDGVVALHNLQQFENASGCTAQICTDTDIVPAVACGVVGSDCKTTVFSGSRDNRVRKYESSI
jgi:proteasomal ATPase-associated factor 1